MKITSVTLLFLSGLILLSCGNEKPIPDGFVCVMPIARVHLEKAKLDVSCYQETADGSGQYVPKGWVVVPDGPYKGCFVPFNNHDNRTTIPPRPPRP